MGRFLKGVILAAAIGGIAYTFTAPTQDTGPRRPAAVEAVSPDGGDLDLRQATILADLATGFTGYLMLDGAEVPADDIRRVEGLNQLILSPGPDSDYAQLQPGLHCATVVYWPIGLTEADGSSYRWCFRFH